MSEESPDLRITLARLHEQLRGSQNLNPETRTLLQGVAADIDALLNEAPAAAAGGQAREARQESIVARLTGAEREFEATHPTLAGIVGSIIDAVGRMGI